MNAQPALHPTDQTLHDYGLGRLDEESAGSVVAHLEGCPDCRRRITELSSGGSSGRPHDARPRPDSLPPALADHPDYEVLRELGRGGMGVVYLARNTLMGRLEVLKVVVGDLIRLPEVLDRFLREIRSAARLHHTNIVAAYSAIRLGESLALAMEYVDGVDLAKLVKTSGPLPIAQACGSIYQSALGLQHAHEHGMVHRDIKPANLILARAGPRPVVKVLDFGLAKVSSEGRGDTSLTREGQMLGTPDYIAPEQIRDAQSADIRADIYSLGCTFHYLLTGAPPFSGNNLWDLYQAHLSRDAGPLNLVRPEVPAELAALVAKMMAKEPGTRFQTPGEVARALLPFVKKENRGSAGARPTIIVAGPPEAKPVPPAAPRAPVRPAAEPANTPPPLPTIAAQPGLSRVRPAMKEAPEPPPLPAKPPQPAHPETVLDGLNDLLVTSPPVEGSRQTLRSSEAGRPDRRHFGAWGWWSAGAVVLLLGLVLIWAAAHPAAPAVRSMEKTITNMLGMKLTLIPLGTFLMGLSEEDRKAFAGAKPPRRVWIDAPFYLGTCEVTRDQFRRFVEVTGYITDAEKDGEGGWGYNPRTRTPEQDPRYTWRDPGFAQDGEHPVVNVSWNDAVAFAAWLSRAEGRNYRLPTEAEWEYACRAGSTTRYSSGDDDRGLVMVGNVTNGTAPARESDRPRIAARDGHVHTAPVGRFRPNDFGLYDMHGNVWEWCSDDFAYNVPPFNDPAGPSEVQQRMIRGGSWEDEPRRCLSGAFVWVPRNYRRCDAGFRLVLVPPDR